MERGRPARSSEIAVHITENVMQRVLVVLLALGLIGFSARAADRQLAEAFAASAAKLAGEGKADKAKDLCYKALANDEDCPEALFELGKLFEKENNLTAAADFFVRAAREFGKEEAAKPAFVSKRLEAESRSKKLNPFSARFSSAMADYSAELNMITKKSTDAFTLEEACDRADSLKLRAILPPDKAPKFERPTVAAKPEKKAPEDEISKFVSRLKKPEPVNSITPDVERALKAGGWEKITGTWKKKSEGVYEVTDGKLETAKLNGAMQVIIHKGGTGTVQAFVRNSQDEYSGSYASWGSGYGFVVEGSSAKIYTPSGGFSDRKFYSYMEREDPLPDANPKNMITVTVEEGKLEYFVNGVKKKSANYQIAKSGPFMIKIDGTMTIEAPQAKGQ